MGNYNFRPAANRRPLWIGIGVVVLLIIAGGGYYLWAQSQTKKAAQTSTPTTTTNTPATTTNTPTTAGAKDVGYVIVDSTDSEATFSKVNLTGIKTKIFTIPKTHKETVVTGTISPDGQTIVYTDKDSSLQSYSLATGKSTLLKASNFDETNVGNNISFSDPLFSPDGKKIGVRWGGWETVGAAILDANGQNFQIITAGCDDADWAWSANSNKFVLGTRRNDLGGGNACVYVADTANPNGGKNILPKNDTTVYEDIYKDVYSPQFSPDGSQIAFGYRYLDYGKDRVNADKAEKYRGIYIINTDGTGFKQVSDNRSFSDTPFWTDNKTIVYSLSRLFSGNNKGVYSIGSDGQGNTALYSADFNSYELISLSPNKKFLVFAAGNKQQVYGPLDNVYIYDFTTKQVKLIGKSVGFVGWLTE